MGAVERAVLHPEKVVGKPRATTTFNIDIDMVKQKRGSLYKGQVILKTSHPQEDKIILRCFVMAEKP
jgi:hypothetical protein